MIRYYAARADEYDDWYLRRGRYADRRAPARAGNHHQIVHHRSGVHWQIIDSQAAQPSMFAEHGIPLQVAPGGRSHRAILERLPIRPAPDRLLERCRCG